MGRRELFPRWREILATIEGGRITYQMKPEEGYQRKPLKEEITYH